MSTVSGEVEDEDEEGVLGADVTHEPDDEEDGTGRLTGTDPEVAAGSEPVPSSLSDGQCWAVALVKLGIFESKEEAVEALDHARDNWTSLPAAYRVDSFLGVRSCSWHVQIVQRVVVCAGYDFIKCKHIFADEDEVILKTSEGGLLELADRSRLFVIDGLVNPKYYRGRKWVETFDKDGPDDTPAKNPTNWQHVTAIKDGKMQPEYGLPVSLKWLWAEEGGVDSEHGYFHEIETIYMLRERAPSYTAELAGGELCSKRGRDPRSLAGLTREHLRKRQERQDREERNRVDDYLE